MTLPYLRTKHLGQGVAVGLKRRCGSGLPRRHVKGQRGKLQDKRDFLHGQVLNLGPGITLLPYEEVVLSAESMF